MQDATESRFTELEIKLSYTEDLVDELNRTVFRQQQQIEYLAGELRQLRDQFNNSLTQEKHSLREEIPPHY